MNIFKLKVENCGLLFFIKLAYLNFNSIKRNNNGGYIIIIIFFFFIFGRRYIN